MPSRLSLTRATNARTRRTPRTEATATGLPALEIRISSPAATRARSLERWVFASCTLTCTMVLLQRLDQVLDQVEAGHPTRGQSATGRRSDARHEPRRDVVTRGSSPEASRVG